MGQACFSLPLKIKYAIECRGVRIIIVSNANFARKLQMPIKRSTVIKLLIAFAFLLLVRVIVSYTVLSSFAVIVVDAEFEKDTRVEVYFSPGEAFQAEKVVRSPLYAAGKRAS